MKPLFTYQIERIIDPGNEYPIYFLLIRDLGDQPTLTDSNLRQVVDSILQHERRHYKTVVIAVCDNDGQWDGWDYESQQFIYIGSDTKQGVFDAYLSFKTIQHEQQQDFRSQCAQLHTERESESDISHEETHRAAR